MHITMLFSIYDRKASYYLPIFQAERDHQAVRGFTDIVTQSDTDVSKYPADFDLMCLGDMDLDTGELFPAKNPRHIINGMSALQAAQIERKKYQSALAPSVETPASES